ncbi:MAG: hypothetical protein HIU92_20535 [Proteobacteria bacterium]|nr:hypothetical protein [Pseudomonadota bacterium]
MPLDDGRMKRFVAALLAEDGGLVEPIEPDGLEVLTTPSIQNALGVGELCRLGFGATLPEGAARVGIEADWLSRFERVVGTRGRWNRRLLVPPSRKAPDAGAVLARTLVLDNATARLVSAVPAWTRILVLDFRVTAMSDEKREGTCRLAVNLATGAMPEWPMEWPGTSSEPEDLAALAADVPEDAALPPDWEGARVIERMRRALPWQVEAQLAPFVTGLRRRLARDLDRLHGYHNDLHREALKRSAQAGGGEAAAQRETLRVEAISREYSAKLSDLAHKYALRISAEWVQTQELIVPVHRLTVQIRRRKAERTLIMDWNTYLRRLEPPHCEASFSTERPRMVCDAELHLVAPSGLAPCEGCGRSYCRACYPTRCKHCGASSETSAFSPMKSPPGHDEE